MFANVRGWYQRELRLYGVCDLAACQNFNSKGQECRKDKKWETQVLLVSKQTHLEALPVLYSSNAFSFNSVYELDMFFCARGKHLQHFVRTVHVIVHDHFYSRSLRSLKSLKKVYMSISDSWYWKLLYGWGVHWEPNSERDWCLPCAAEWRSSAVSYLKPLDLVFDTTCNNMPCRFGKHHANLHN